MPTTKFQATAGDARSAILIELFEFGLRFRVEDNPAFHPLLGFRLQRAMTGLQPGKYRFKARRTETDSGDAL